ncbi:MAG TPA: hypothetical protein VIH72_01695 [Candidatus Acidoferrales bacterium]
MIPRLRWKKSRTIRLHESDSGNIAPDEPSRFSVWRAATIFLGALIFLWPAILNRLPLLYPDSMTYLADGRPVARALFLHKFSNYYGMRSLIYSLGIFPFHWNITLWPVAALQSLLAAYVIWLVVRSVVARQTLWWYLILCASLSLLTTLSWFAALILPDILGPILYLCIYLIVFAREALSRAERAAVIVIIWWAVASHGSHLIVATALCALLILLNALHCKFMQQRWRAVGAVMLVILFSVAAQVGLNKYLTGNAALDADWPPILMARMIEDGPGRQYIETHCPDAKFAICEDVQHLPADTDDFLWSDTGIWQSASAEKQARLQHEEIRFVLATVRAYPGEQLKKSAANFGNQLITLGMDDLTAADWTLEGFDRAIPAEKSHYEHSRQISNALPLDFFSSVQGWMVIASLAVIAAFIPYLRRYRPARILGLGVIIVSAVLMNAFVTGVLSAVEPRYQSRVIWLLPLLAALLILDWRGQRSLHRTNAE